MTSVHHAAIINEQRKFPRFDIEIPASIRLKDRVYYQGKTNNISSNGAFIKYSADTKITGDTHCILTLYVEGKAWIDEIKIKCVSKPARDGGIGLEFKTMSADDFVNFVFLLTSEAPDADDLFAELRDNPGVELVNEI
ncbi:MAG: PilZ domain-containing protein [Gammaproteobacteria bacterium]|jgi:hypothetical protein